MGKVILTESQYRRLKKRLINIQLNEQDTGGLAGGAVGGAIVGATVGSALGPVGTVLGGLAGLAYQAYQGFKGGSYSGVKALFSVCASTGVGKTTMSQAALNNISKALYDAVRVWNGTDEDAIKAALSQVKTIPDFCAVNKTYSENYPGYTLLADLDGDIDNDSEWNEYVYLPLLNAKRNTDEIIKKAKLLPAPAPGPSEITWTNMPSGQIIAFQRWYWSVIEKDLPRVSGDVKDTCKAKYASALCGGSPCILNQAVDGRLGQNFVKLTNVDANRRAFEAWWKINKNAKTPSGIPYTSLPPKCSNVNPNPNPNPKTKPKTKPKTVPVNTGSGGKRPSDPTFPGGYESGLK